MQEIKFIDVGEGINEGHIRKWLVNDGDQVKEDQPVVQVETDKAVVNVPAPISGTLRQNVKENTDVHVGDTIAFIGTPDEVNAAISQPQTRAAAPQPVERAPAARPAEQAEAQPAAAGKIATPAVRKLARDLGIDISQVTGTGPGGRILESDLKSGSAQPSQQKEAPKFSGMLEEQHKGAVERVKMSQTRKAIAKNMEVSGAIPRAVHMDLINATRLFELVQREKPNFEKLGSKLTFLPFIIKAAIEALKESPNFNASYDRDTQEIIVKKYYNIGLAAESPDGLKVVVIKNADKMSILDISKDIVELHKRVLDGTISLADMHDSTFTITNIGSLGGGFLSVPMINPPEVAILGIHLIKDWPMIEGGQVRVGKVLPYSLAFDHRVVDGAEAAKFGITLTRYLEDPDLLKLM